MFSILSFFLLGPCFLAENVQVPLPTLGWPATEQAGDAYRCEDGKINLHSEAPLETIDAQSNKLRGIIQVDQQKFAWSVEIKTLSGFNSPLQKEHFNENYMETTKYPTATFSGKIIEQVDFTKDGTYPVRAKGQLVIHGIARERIIKSTLTIKGGKIIVRSTFTVPLSEHSINIPKIVFQKISEEAIVYVDAILQK